MCSAVVGLMGLSYPEKYLDMSEKESYPAACLPGLCFSSCLGSFPDVPHDRFLTWKCQPNKPFLPRVAMVLFIPATESKLVQVHNFHELSLVEANILFHVPLVRLSSLMYSTPEKYGQAVCLKVSLINSQQSLLWGT